MCINRKCLKHSLLLEHVVEDRHLITLRGVHLLELGTINDLLNINLNIMDSNWICSHILRRPPKSMNELEYSYLPCIYKCIRFLVYFFTNLIWLIIYCLDQIATFSQLTNINIYRIPHCHIPIGINHVNNKCHIWPY